MHTSRFIRTEAVVIKRTNYADADRFVTFFSSTLGKISARARGVRKMNSRKRSSLEPMNHVKIHLIKSNYGYLITESVLVESFSDTKTTLPRLTQAMQLLEIVDNLTAEEEDHPGIYRELLKTLHILNYAHADKEYMVDMVKYVLDELGFGYPNNSEVGLKAHIEEISQKRLVTKKFMLQ